MNDVLAGSDRYRIQREIGAGGMARVFLAEDLRHERQVAVKVLRRELASGVGKDRFLREIKFAARLTHPNIVPLFDSGEHHEDLYFVMPFVEGASLRECLGQKTTYTMAEAIKIARSVASALDYAHRHGVVHRDIKPENILVHDGEPMITDFGIGKALRAAGGDDLTRVDSFIGTAAYMSPEQIAGDRDVDGRSDLYSLGCILYEMLTGERLHTGSTPIAVIGLPLSEAKAQKRFDDTTISGDAGAR